MILKKPSIHTLFAKAPALLIAERLLPEGYSRALPETEDILFEICPRDVDGFSPDARKSVQHAVCVVVVGIDHIVCHAPRHVSSLFGVRSCSARRTYSILSTLST
jgi:hypothetical protein